MKIAELPEWEAARTRFEQMWREKHPAAPPPDLYPPHLEDPIWVEADRMMDEALVKTRADLTGNSTFESAVQSPTWIALAGYIGCPNNHTFSMTAAHCPTCGLGPVPLTTKLAAEEAARRLGERAGLAMIRLAGL